MARRRIPLVALLGSILLLGVVGAAPPAQAAQQAAYVVMFKDSVTDTSASATSVLKRTGGKHDADYGQLQAFSADLSPSQAQAVASDPSVAFVTPDRVLHEKPEPRRDVDCRHFTGSPAVEQCIPENIERIGAADSSQRSGDGAGAVTGPIIGVLDSGVDATDVDLHVIGGVDCTNGTPVRLGAASDVEGHGTEVAGVAAAVDDHEGLVGVAPSAPIFSVQVLGADDAGSLESLLCGVNYVTSTLTDRDPGNDIRVANGSFSGDIADLGTTTADDGACGRRNHDPLHLAICRSVAHGAVYSVGAGNDGIDISKKVPAGYREVITSTAITDLDGRPGGKGGTDCFGMDIGAPIADDTPVFFSDYATSLIDRAHTVAAVGSCVITTYPDYYAVVDFGTSFSAPATTGVIELCIASGRCPRGAPAATIVKILADTARYNLRHPAYGYAGDPLHSKPSDPYYGFLVSAAQY